MYWCCRGTTVSVRRRTACNTWIRVIREEFARLGVCPVLKIKANC